MKIESVKVNNTITLFSIMFFGIFGIFLFKVNQMTHDLSTKIDSVASYIKVQKKLASIDTERQASIKKIEDIISRYNKTMPELTKYNIANEIFLMSRKYSNLNIDFIAATITHESASTWDPAIVSRVGAIGLMQIMPATGIFLASEEGLKWNRESILFDPLVNIRLGCRYLSAMVNMYEKDGGLAAYNGGPKIAELWLASDKNDNILWAETRDYVPAVLKLYNEFRTEGPM